MAKKVSAKAIHPAVYFLALSLFAMGSAEFLMGGILPMIAEDLQITLPGAGTLISAFAVGALIGGPPFAILALRWPGRSILFFSQMAFIVATASSLLAQGYWPILVARFTMGLAYACFWAVAAATAVQLSHHDRRAKALSMTDRVRSSSPGHRYAYTRSVMAADECPSTVWTCFKLAPPDIKGGRP